MVDDLIRTADLKCQKRLFFRLSHIHQKEIVLFSLLKIGADDQTEEIV